MRAVGPGERSIGGGGVVGQGGSGIGAGVERGDGLD